MTIEISINTKYANFKTRPENLQKLMKSVLNIDLNKNEFDTLIANLKPKAQANLLDLLFKANTNEPDTLNIENLSPANLTELKELISNSARHSDLDEILVSGKTFTGGGKLKALTVAQQDPTVKAMEIDEVTPDDSIDQSEFGTAYDAYIRPPVEVTAVMVDTTTQAADIIKKLTEKNMLAEADLQVIKNINVADITDADLKKQIVSLKNIINFLSNEDTSDGWKIGAAYKYTDSDIVASLNVLAKKNLLTADMLKKGKETITGSQKLVHDKVTKTSLDKYFFTTNGTGDISLNNIKLFLANNQSRKKAYKQAFGDDKPLAVVLQISLEAESDKQFVAVPPQGFGASQVLQNRPETKAIDFPEGANPSDQVRTRVATPAFNNALEKAQKTTPAATTITAAQAIEAMTDMPALEYAGDSSKYAIKLSGNDNKTILLLLDKEDLLEYLTKVDIKTEDDLINALDSFIAIQIQFKDKKEVYSDAGEVIPVDIKEASGVVVIVDKAQIDADKALAACKDSLTQMDSSNRISTLPKEVSSLSNPGSLVKDNGISIVRVSDHATPDRPYQFTFNSKSFAITVAQAQVLLDAAKPKIQLKMEKLEAYNTADWETLNVDSEIDTANLPTKVGDSIQLANETTIVCTTADVDNSKYTVTIDGVPFQNVNLEQAQKLLVLFKTNKPEPVVPPLPKTDTQKLEEKMTEPDFLSISIISSGNASVTYDDGIISTPVPVARITMDTLDDKNKYVFSEGAVSGVADDSWMQCTDAADGSETYTIFIAGEEFEGVSKEVAKEFLEAIQKYYAEQLDQARII